ncbi:aspartic peptidase domain-containing protein [Suillus lakei]|nr:aspartic peptidase domain-containing protein [Suillus lakei]
MHKRVRSILAAFNLLYSAAAELASRNSGYSPNGAKRMQGGLHLPLSRRLIPKRLTLGADTGVAGLGDFFDVTYSVLIDIGGTSLPVVLDTGSSDLWVLSTICQGTCSSANTALYPPNTFHNMGLDATLVYGDSQTGTYARGIIGYDAVSLAGLTLQDQYFAAINDTNTSVVQTRCSGIFGLGFPLNSVIWTDMFLNQHQVSGRRSLHRDAVSRITVMWRSYASRWFDKSILGISSSRHTDPPSYQPMPQEKRQATTLSAIISSFGVSGPFIPRLVSLGALAEPMFAIALQRDTIEIGGNEGMLSIGGLPPGVQNESLTWAPVRKYTLQQDGLTQDASLETYPIAWEIPVDDVFLDGVKLPRSQLSSPNISLSALIDTGNSLIRGPPDVISYIQNMLGGPQFACSSPHTLAFQIGGRLFPVDPRDFVNQVRSGNVQVCAANLAQTDVPVLGGGGYLYSWSLGDPFLKGVLAAFYYGSFAGLSQRPSTHWAPIYRSFRCRPTVRGRRLSGSCRAIRSSWNEDVATIFPFFPTEHRHRGDPSGISSTEHWNRGDPYGTSSFRFCSRCRREQSSWPGKWCTRGHAGRLCHRFVEYICHFSDVDILENTRMNVMFNLYEHFAFPSLWHLYHVPCIFDIL